MKRGTTNTVQTKTPSFQSRVLVSFLLFTFHSFCPYFFFISHTSRLLFLTLGGTLFVYAVCHALDCWFILVFCYICFDDLSCHHIVRPSVC